MNTDKHGQKAKEIRGHPCSSASKDNRPTRKLVLSIHFPDGLRPKPFDVEVRYASASPGIPSDQIQVKEQTRLQPSMEVPAPGRHVLELDVDYPMIGLIYLVWWRPLCDQS